MLVENKPINFQDSRGTIRDILVGHDIDAITLLTCRAGSVRGNHFHAQSIQYMYVISGRLLCAAQVGEETVEYAEVSAGDLVTNPAGEKHAFKALEDASFLSLTKGPRKGQSFESDTYRLEKKILE